MDIILTPHSAGGWWALYNDSGPQIRAFGKDPSEALTTLQTGAPYPYQPGDPSAELDFASDGTAAFACYDGYTSVLVRGNSVREAREMLVAHVPIPQPSDRPVGDVPPKLTDRPLPPV